MTLAIGHLSAEGVAVLDLVREIRPPFNPEEATAEMAGVLRLYDVSRVLGDRYAGEWVPARFKENGIHYEPSAKPKSQIYSDLLPMLTSGKVELLENVRLSAQLCGLERRTARGGRDSVDHSPGGHDDLINAVAGVLVQLDLDRRPAMIRQADLLTADLPAAIEHPHAFNCIVWVTPDGQSAVALFSYQMLLPGGAQIVLEWFDTSPWTPGLLLNAARRLDEFCDAAYARSNPVKERGGCAAFLLTQQEMVQPALAAMQEVFSAKLEVEYHRRRGRTRNVNALPIAPAYASNPSRLSLGAAGHVAAGAVKLSAEALALSGGKPLLGSLAIKPGEAVDANPLRMALLIGIAQLDAEWDDEGGAQVRFG